MSSAAVSPCDNIFTYFPADENETVDLGRLGEESQRLSKIFKTATRHSLLLLNESLATTSVAEGVFIAKGVVKSMRYLGVRAIFNTHMHELATSVGEINESVAGESRIESLITTANAASRSALRRLRESATPQTLPKNTASLLSKSRRISTEETALKLFNKNFKKITAV